MFFKKKPEPIKPRQATKASEFAALYTVQPPQFLDSRGLKICDVSYRGWLSWHHNRMEAMSPEDAVNLGRWLLDTFSDKGELQHKEFRAEEE